MIKKREVSQDKQESWPSQWQETVIRWQVIKTNIFSVKAASCFCPLHQSMGAQESAFLHHIQSEMPFIFGRGL
jgi:hypothetical protein